MLSFCFATKKHFELEKLESLESEEMELDWNELWMGGSRS
jgi:hypothetical protein